MPYYYIYEQKERSFKARCDMCNANGAVIDMAIMDGMMHNEQENLLIKKSLLELRVRLAGKSLREQGVGVP